MKKSKGLSRRASSMLVILGILVLGFAMVLPMVLASSAPDLIFKLDFSDSQNLGKNTAYTDIPDAEFIGSGLVFTENEIQGKGAVKLPGGSARTNYIVIDGSVLNNESITIAAWYKIPSDVAGWARTLEVYGDEDNFISIMPYAPNYYNGFHVCGKIGGTVLKSAVDPNADNILFKSGDPTASINVPEAGYVLPVYDAWVHYAYEFTPEGFSVYQNGVLLTTVEGNFSASQFFKENSGIALGATLVKTLGDGDIKASFADVRIYDGALGEEKIKSEYNFKYTDFLTTSYDFENGTSESVRGYNGVLTGTASVGNVTNKGNVLILDGNTNGENTYENRSSMSMPSKVIHGHNNITIMMDLYVDSATNGWARVFEFAVDPKASWIFATKWGNADTNILSFTTGVEKVINCQSFFDKWVNLAITVEGKTAKIIIDGEVIAYSEDYNYKNGMCWGGDVKASLGQQYFYGDRPMVGMMDNVKIYQCALTTDEIKKEMNGSDDLIYNLDFSDADNRGNNAANTGYADAEFTGSGFEYTENAIKGNTAVMLSGGSVRTNYIAIDGAVLNNDSITIAGWFKIPSDVAGWARLLEIYGDEDNLISIMPYAPNYHNGLHICGKIGGTVLKGANDCDNIVFKGEDPTAKINVPEAGYVLPVYDTWVHYAYELTPTALNIYQNGKLLDSIKGNFSASQFYKEGSEIALGATLVKTLGDGDIKASYADIRVYSGALGADKITSEYDLKYTDFLTTNYDFENGAVDSVRDYNGTLIGNAAIKDIEGKGNVLVLDGSGGSDNNKEASMKVPSKILHGHNNITITMDLYVDKKTGGWTRVFEFGVDPAASWIFATKWGNENTNVLSYTTGVEKFVNTQSFFDEWVKLAITIEGNVAKVFVNGELAGINENYNYKNGMYWGGNSEAMAFGRTFFYGDAPLTGMMDNIKIYQTALTDKEVMAEAGIISEQNDMTAVQNAFDKLSVNWDGEAFNIDLPATSEDGVTISWLSSDEDIITNAGKVTKPAKDTDVILRAYLTRGGVTMLKSFKLFVQAANVENPSIVFDTLLDAVHFEDGSYYEGLMETNVEFMMKLDPERILANYRKWAGLDTNGATGYPNAGGEGQFESHHMLAIMKASIVMPDYTYEGETLIERFTYYLTELKKCQDALAESSPEDAGYVGAIPTDWFYAIEEGRWTDKYGNGIVVPWYIAHKTVQMLLDTYQCIEDETLKNLAYEMMIDWCDWAYRMIDGHDEDMRYKILRVEYGGLPEEFYEIYSITRDIKHLKLARFFEEEKFFARVYNNEAIVLVNAHANTWIPKFLGCCAAYEATGDEYYKQICINGFEMIMDHVYSMGGTSNREHWQETGKLENGQETCETCCTYNLIKYADYLYRWTGDKKYADYIDRAYTNHILSSMAPDTGLKTYLVSSAHGMYKVYLSMNNCFECCCSTGQESFAKLTQNIYYTAENRVIVNMFFPSEIVTPDGFKLVQSGNFFTDQKTLFTVDTDGEYTLSIRIPYYTDEKSVSVKINGEAYNFSAENGYINITRSFTKGDKIEYSVPFKFNLELLLGNENNYALMYGPMLLVADLGNENVNDAQDSHKTFGTAYTGPVTNKIVLADTLDKSAKVSYDEDGNITVMVSTKNHGDLKFVPFNQIFHSRYGMYFEYYDTVEEADKGYKTEGNEYQVTFNDESAVTDHDEYSSAGGNFEIKDGKLVSPASGEHKLMLGLNVKNDYTVDVSVSPVSENGAINNGVYIMASGAKDAVDMIVAYNVHIEKAAGENTYKILIHKMKNGYLGNAGSVSLAFPEDGIIDLHIFISETKITVYAEESKNPVLSVAIDQSVVTSTRGDVGLRSFNCAASFDNVRVTAATVKTVGTEFIKETLADAEKIDTTLYTKESADALKSAIESAKALIALADKTQKDVNDAEAAILDAVAALEKASGETESEKVEALKAAIADAKKIDKTLYTEESYAALAAAIANAEKADLASVSEADAEALKNAILDAVASLVKVTPAVTTPSPSVTTVSPSGTTAAPGTTNANNPDDGSPMTAIIIIVVIVVIIGSGAAFFVIKKKK